MIKVDYNREIQTQITAPAARMNHAGVFAALSDSETIINNNTNLPIVRKYLYIFGGFSRECTTACYDTWRYEISYGPYAYYPRSTSNVYKTGNYWEL